MKKDAYLSLLGDRGIPHMVVGEESEDVEPGYVISVNPQPGSTIDLESGTIVEVVVSR